MCGHRPGTRDMCHGTGIGVGMRKRMSKSRGPAPVKNRPRSVHSKEPMGCAALREVGVLGSFVVPSFSFLAPTDSQSRFSLGFSAPARNRRRPTPQVTRSGPKFHDLHDNLTLPQRLSPPSDDVHNVLTPPGCRAATSLGQIHWNRGESRKRRWMGHLGH